MSILTGDNPFYISEKKGPCWTGYKKVPGKKDYEDGSCVKEGDEGFEEYWNSLSEDEQVEYMEVAMECEGWDDLSEEAAELDEAGLWDNIHAKRKRIKNGSGERMRKPGSEGAPSNKDLKDSQNEEYVEEEDISTSKKSGNFRSTESGAGMTDKGVKAYKAKNPGSKLKTAVTGDAPKGSKAAGRRKSFCARSRGWTGERGKAARRRWKC